MEKNVRAPFEASAPQKIKWIDGLRGVASFMVIITHLTRAFDPLLFSTRDDETAPIRLFQLPILRIAPQGRIGVIIFSFVTGYVCALKPIRLIRDGNQSAALSTIAKSAFRRFPRLFLPTMVVTVIAWLLCQLGAFEVAKHCDSSWLSWASPDRKEFWDGLISLLWNLSNTWITGHNDYDDHQWTLLPLVKGALMIYVVMSGVVYMQTKYRMLSAALLCLYFYCGGESAFGVQFFYGMLLCDISQDPEIQSFIAKRRWMTTVLPVFLSCMGLWFCSYPGEHPEWANWCRPLLRLQPHILPLHLPFGDASIPWMFNAIGLDMLALGLQLSPLARDVLSNRFFLWLGRNSFAVYLTHGTMLRVVLTRMLYGNQIPAYVETRNDAGEIIPSEPMHLMSWHVRVLAVPVWFAMVYYVAYLWTNYVDAWAARATKRLENHVFEDEEDRRDLRLP